MSVSVSVCVPLGARKMMVFSFKTCLRRFGYVHVSPGEILRSHVQRETGLGKQAKAFMDAGKLVPHEIIIQIVKELDGATCCLRCAGFSLLNSCVIGISWLRASVL